jgi:hypothetical protein
VEAIWKVEGRNDDSECFEKYFYWGFRVMSSIQGISERLGYSGADGKP